MEGKMNNVLLGSKLKKLRINTGMKLKELTGLLGVEQSTISGYENGKSAPSIEVLYGYRRVFNVDLNWLLDEESEKNIILTALNRKDSKMVRQFQTFSEDEKSPVRQIINVIFNSHLNNDKE